ncbi:MAG: ABC transporter ATP-binding protein/permease [Acetobacteraceae bacterium]|nr:ABC transporter ATP-binding protein/permease [Acetobacteraceae bacterium]
MTVRTGTRAAIASTLGDVARLALPWWTSEERLKAWALLGIVVGLTLALVGMDVAFSFWQARFYNALQERDWQRFLHELGFFCVLAAIYIAVAVYQLYLQQALQILWRRWLTERMLTDWLADFAYYRIHLADPGTDNPDQRIAEDLRLFVDSTLSLGLGLINAIVTLFSFLFVLWELSGPITVLGVTIPGYMVWVALVYAGLGTWITHLVGRALIALNFEQQRLEADFRYRLVRVRENVEGIAFYRGEADEKSALVQTYMQLMANWWAIAGRTKTLTWFTAFYGQLASVFPVIVVAPRYFAGAMQIGDLFQTATAFGQVRASLSWVITSYQAISGWKATVDRLAGFDHAVARARAAMRAGEGVRMAAGTAPELRGAHLNVRLPDQVPLIEDATITVAPGEAVLLAGPSGSGKTTLLRALAGIWPFGGGTVEVPEGRRALFLPQRPYIPLGTLRAAIAYPDNVLGHGDDAVIAAMQAAGLDQFVPLLDQANDWARRLSGGEQQRLGFARAFLIRPDFVVLDEATASLDPASEALLYRRLRERLPRAGILSVAHGESVVPFHDRRVELVRPPGAAGHLLAA